MDESGVGSSVAPARRRSSLETLTKSPYKDLFARILLSHIPAAAESDEAHAWPAGVGESGGALDVMETILDEMDEMGAADGSSSVDKGHGHTAFAEIMTSHVRDLCVLLGDDEGSAEGSVIGGNIVGECNADGFDDEDSLVRQDAFLSMDDLEVSTLVHGLHCTTLHEDEETEDDGAAGFAEASTCFEDEALGRLLADAKQRAATLLAARAAGGHPDFFGRRDFLGHPEVGAAVDGLLWEAGARLDAKEHTTTASKECLSRRNRVERMLKRLPDRQANELRDAFQKAHLHIQRFTDGQALLRKVTAFEWSVRLRDLWARFEEACNRCMPAAKHVETTVDVTPEAVEEAFSRVMGRLEMEGLFAKSTLPPPALKVLTDWFLQHFEHPYPTPEEKEDLVRESGLQPKQVTYWFTNARIRVWRHSIFPHLRDQSLEKRRQRKAKKKAGTQKVSTQKTGTQRFASKKAAADKKAADATPVQEWQPKTKV